MGALISIGLAFAFSAVIVGLTYAAIPNVFGLGDDRSLLFVKSSGLAFYLFERTPLLVHETGSFDTTDIRLVGAPLLGLALLAIAFYVGGSSAAGRTSGGPTKKLVAGALTVIPLAFGALLAPILFPDAREFSNSGAFSGVEEVTVLPLYPWAFWLTLLWGGVFAVVGASRRAYAEPFRDWIGKRLESLVRGSRAALKGAGSGALWGIALSALTAAGILVQLFIVHSDVRSYVLDNGHKAVATAITALLFLPNAAAAVFATAEGASFHLALSPFDVKTYSYAHNLPIYAWLGLLIPSICFVRAGYVAARASRQAGPSAVKSALLAAIPLTLFWWLMALLSGLSATVQGSEEAIGIGPSAFGTFLLTPVWAIIGAWLGALLWLRHIELPSAPDAPQAEIL